MSKFKKKFKRGLPYYSSIVPFDIVGYYTHVTKTQGELYQDGQRSIWLSPYNQLIFNLPKKYNYQGTMVTTLPLPLSNHPQNFNYFDQDLTIVKMGNGVLISSQYQADLVTNFVPL
jgi:hypothetical protein